jgi:hypothetical protein
MPDLSHASPAGVPASAAAVAARFTKEYGPAVADGDLMTWTLESAALESATGDHVAVTVVLATATPRVSIFAPHRARRPKVSRTLIGQEQEIETLVRAIGRRCAA